MESLGCVETVSGEGRFVVKAVTVPEMNETVYTRDGKKLGTVKRIFGPIEGPYVTVAAIDGEADDITGIEVYHKGEIKNAKRKRKD